MHCLVKHCCLLFLGSLYRHHLSLHLSLHVFIHVIKISTMIVAVFITHPASESFFVSSRSFLAIVPLQSIVISERFTAWLTFVRWIRMVFSFVIKQCLFPGETFVTLSTLKGSFSTMYPQMTCKWDELRKYFLHREHSKGLSLLCIDRCVFKSEDFLKHFWRWVLL